MPPLLQKIKILTSTIWWDNYNNLTLSTRYVWDEGLAKVTLMYRLVYILSIFWLEIQLVVYALVYSFSCWIDWYTSWKTLSKVVCVQSNDSKLPFFQNFHRSLLLQFSSINFPITQSNKPNKTKTPTIKSKSKSNHFLLFWNPLYGAHQIPWHVSCVTSGWNCTLQAPTSFTLHKTSPLASYTLNACFNQ